MGELYCPQLGGFVEWTDERERHVTMRHPDLLPDHRPSVILTLQRPDQIQVSLREPQTLLVSRWFDDILGGKHLVVVVRRAMELEQRNTLLTAYLTRMLGKGVTIWRRT